MAVACDLKMARLKGFVVTYLAVYRAQDFRFKTSARQGYRTNGWFNATVRSRDACFSRLHKFSSA